MIKKNKSNSEPRVSADGKVIMTYCKPPEGAFLELVEEIQMSRNKKNRIMQGRLSPLYNNKIQSFPKYYYKMNLKKFVN